MKWNTTQKVAFGIGFGILALAISLRFMGIARPVLMGLHLLSLAAFAFALLARGKPGSQP